MPTVLDLLDAPEFAAGELTEAINIPPYETGRLAQLGLFTDKPITTTYAKIGIKDGDITIIPSRERGGPSNLNMGSDRDYVLIPVPHFPLDDAVTPSDIQNLHAFNEPQALLSLQGVVNDKLVDMRAKHDATFSFMDWGAINGIVLDAENKVLVNLFDTFGISQSTFDLILGAAGTDVAQKTRDLKSAMRRQLKGAPMTGVRILAGAEYFAAYVGHATVKDAYKYFAGQPNPNRDELADGFSFAGVTIEQTDEEFTVRNADNTLSVMPGVAADEAIALPLGTPYFRRYISPPDTVNEANVAPSAENRVYVAPLEDRKFGKGKDIHTESNVLPVCLRPQAMFKLSL